MSIVNKKFQFGDQTVEIETGKIARQATGAVTIKIGDTVVLATVVGNKKAKEGQDFFPLTVNYQEKGYAAGKVPGGYFKREARPTTKETLTARLIDRPLRPLFPAGFVNEVQVILTVVSMDPEIDPDVVAMLGASAALAISGIPFAGPVGGARVGYKDGAYILNPTETQMADSELDLVVAGTEHAVLMVESEAQGLSEEVMLGAVMFGHQQMQVVINAIKELAAEAGKEKWSWEPATVDQDLEAKVAELATQKIEDAYNETEKMARYAKLDVVKQEVLANFEDADVHADVLKFVETIKKTVVRERVLGGSQRIDGRDTKTVRPIAVETGLLPRAHGSALFTRGETQAIVAATLATKRDAQIMEDFRLGDVTDNFMLHYNFPPYSVGEAGMLRGPGRREIGHGMLAKRGMSAVLPTLEEFPYVLRVVSEITESNGSSSMASVCGTSLALMDAGVPLKAPVSGVAMGLVKEGDRFAVLTDILGDEDHLGDMDFKVAGTADGVNALQMDIKIDGITEEIMKIALEQAKDARIHILGEMNKVISQKRDDLSEFAPRMKTIQISKDKIRDVIGKGGDVIRGLCSEFEVTIDIDDDGKVTIASTDKEKSDGVEQRIKDITAEPEVGTTYEGKVVKIADFGAFVNILPGTDGLVHISEIAHERVNDVNDHLKEGDVIQVKLIGMDRGKLKLSQKALIAKPE